MVVFVTALVAVLCAAAAWACGVPRRAWSGSEQRALLAELAPELWPGVALAGGAVLLGALAAGAGAATALTVLAVVAPVCAFFAVDRWARTNGAQRPDVPAAARATLPRGELLALARTLPPGLLQELGGLGTPADQRARVHAERDRRILRGGRDGGIRWLGREPELLAALEALEAADAGALAAAIRKAAPKA